MSQRPDRPVPRAVIVVCVAVVTAGCGRATDVRPGDIRTYSVARPAPVTVATTAPASGPADRRTANVRFEVPPGWSDRGGSGMRLATLVIGDPADGHEVTVIPAAGSLRGNVERWQGQLDAAADEADRAAAVDRALATAETIDVDGTPATIVVLYDTAAAEGPDADGQAILGAMIPVGEDASLFVKFKGDAAVARQEKDAFVRFVSSLRWK